MTDRDIAGKLKMLAKSPVAIDPAGREAVIAAVHEQELPIKKQAGYLEFLVTQVRFIDKTALFWQLVWLVLFVCAVWKEDLLSITSEKLCILSMTPPLLLLLSIEQVARIYNRSMLEIEYATKYSLKKIVMGRMLILSIGNGIVLLTGILIAGNLLGLSVGSLTAYGLAPLVIMTFLLLCLMQKWSGEQLVYAGVSIYAVMLLLVLFGRNEYLNIFAPAYQNLWLAVLAAGVCGTAAAVKRLGRTLEHFESLTV